ncbi:MAG TPA: hypothetical protein EYN67_02420 [Flavobacteriales bacterium]|nr:hypothetical protein [Flavobacteriales bacterium]
MVSLGKWLIYGLVGAFAISALVDPARAQGTIGAFSGVGTALGSLGSGVQSLLTGVGTGTAKLFNPLFTLRDLIYGPQAGVQIPTDIRQSTSTQNLTTKQEPFEMKSIMLDPAAPYTPVTTGFGGTPALGEPPNYSVGIAQEGAAEAANTAIQGFSYRFTPSISPAPVAQVMVHGESLPLSQAAISHYQALGVTVSPEVNQTIQSQNSGNATGASSASANYSAGAAQAAGYSTGRPRS